MMLAGGRVVGESLRRITAGMLRAVGAVALVALGACADAPEEAAGPPPPPPPPPGAERVEVVGGKAVYLVDILPISTTGRGLQVWAQSGPPLGPGDLETAQSVAGRAGAVIDCGAGSLSLEPGSARYEGAGAAADGAVAPQRLVWQFRGRCGG